MTKEQIITAILALLTAIGLFMLGIFQTGCQSAPSKKDFETGLEFTLADCLYRSQKNPIVCDKIAERYRDWHKEQSYKDKLQYCNNPANLPIGWTGEACRNYLNQK